MIPPKSRLPKLSRPDAQKRLIAWIFIIISGIFLSSHSVAAAENAKELPGAGDPVVTPEFLERAEARYNLINSAHSRFVHVNGVRLHYLTWGDENDLPLVWLHGYSSTAFEMASVAERLVGEGYRVIALTYRGHGMSRVENFDFSEYTIADDAAGLMDELGLNRAVIGGWSMGASIAAAFFATYPDRVTALVLVDGGTVWPQLLTARAAVVEHEAPLPANTQPEVPTPSESKGEALTKFAARLDPQAQQALDDNLGALLFSFLREDGSGRWVFHADHRQMIGSWALLDDPYAVEQLPMLARSHLTILPAVIFRNLEVPMLLIDPTGDDDDVFRARSADNETLASKHPRWIHHVPYPDTPHMAHPLRPDWFIRDMRQLRAWIANTGSEDCD